MDTVFERVIGLGFWCATKGQINAYFCPELPWMKTKKGHADLFDWLFINDYNKLSLALSNELNDFFELKDMSTHDSGFFNKKYNMNWNHLRNNFSAETYSPETFFQQTKEKIDYLKEKFIDAKTNKTLYIISHPECGPNLETLIKVRDSLTKIREGNNQFRLLFVTNLKKYEGIENIIVREAKNLPPPGMELILFVGSKYLMDSNSHLIFGIKVKPHPLR